MNALARTERAAGRPGADRGPLEAARRDLEDTLRRRHAAERDRARLAAKMVDLLGRLRAASRTAGRRESASDEAQALDAATSEVEALLAACPAPASR